MRTGKVFFLFFLNLSEGRGLKTAIQKIEAEFYPCLMSGKFKKKESDKCISSLARQRLKIQQLVKLNSIIWWKSNTQEFSCEPSGQMMITRLEFP
jgi:hypothetical protein